MDLPSQLPPTNDTLTGESHGLTADTSISSSVRSLFNKAIDGNPYFAAGGGLMVLGAGLATLRQGVVRGAGFAYRLLLVDLEIPSKDKLYLWFLEWMAKNPGRRSRHLLVETAVVEHENGALLAKFSLVPGPGKHLLKYQGAYMLVNRERLGKLLDMTNGAPFETVTITTLRRDQALFAQLLLDARKLAVAAHTGKTVLYSSWGPEWRPFGLPRAKRLLGLVVLDDGLGELILADVRDFLLSAEWYHQRGIPYRRGYLLYGPPGSGKTLFIQALAGELDYSICILNLAEPNLTDDRLNHLMNHLPPRLILLLEDVDAAFTKRQLNDDKYAGGVTFSGLLNALDGVASAQECITFMTTNHPEKLDRALLRPGRVDYKVLVGNALPHQVRKMFMRFYTNEQKLCDEFMARYAHLRVPNVSTAALQGLFVYNKRDPRGAIAMIESLRAKTGDTNEQWMDEGNGQQWYEDLPPKTESKTKSEEQDLSATSAGKE